MAYNITCLIVNSNLIQQYSSTSTKYSVFMHFSLILYQFIVILCSYCISERNHVTIFILLFQQFGRKVKMGCGVILTVLQAKDQIKIQQEIKQRNSNSSQLSSQHLIKRISKNNQQITNIRSTEDKENCMEKQVQKKDIRIATNMKQYQSTKLPEIKEQIYNQTIPEIEKDITNQVVKDKESNSISKINISNNLTPSKPQLQTIKEQKSSYTKNTPTNKTKEASIKKPQTPQTPSILKSPRHAAKESKVQQLTLKQNQPSNLSNQAVSSVKPSQDVKQKSNGSMTGKNTLENLPTGRNHIKRESIKVEAMKKMSQKSKNQISSKNNSRSQVSKKSIKVKALVPVDSLYLQSVITAEKTERHDDIASDNPSQIKTKTSQITKKLQEPVEPTLQKSKVIVEQLKSPQKAKDSTKSKEPAKANKIEVKNETNSRKNEKKQQSAIKQPEAKKNNQNMKKTTEKKAEQARIIAQTKKRLYQEQKKKLQNESNKLKKVYLLQ